MNGDAMKPMFSTVKANFYPSQNVSQPKLFESAGLALCGTNCFWLAKEVWFWPLN